MRWEASLPPSRTTKALRNARCSASARAFVWLRSFSLGPPMVVSLESRAAVLFGLSHLPHLLRHLSEYVGGGG